MELSQPRSMPSIKTLPIAVHLAERRARMTSDSISSARPTTANSGEVVHV